MILSFYLFFCCRGAHILFLAAASICSIFFFFCRTDPILFFCTRDPILFLAAALITGHHLAANGHVRWLTLMKEFPRKREHLQMIYWAWFINGQHYSSWTLSTLVQANNLSLTFHTCSLQRACNVPSIWFYASCYKQRDCAIIDTSINATLVRVATCLLSMPFFSKPLTLWPLVAPCSFNKDH